MDRRYVIALILMGLVMLGWIYLQMKIAPPRVKERSVQQQEVQKQKRSEPQPQAKPIDISKPPKKEKTGQIVTVETDLYVAKFDTKDATAVSWRLKGYQKKHSQADEPIDLIPFSAMYCLKIEFADPTLQWLAANTAWKADKPELVLTDQNPTDSLTFTARLGELLIVRKVLTFHKGSYVVDMEIELKNLLDKPLNQIAAGYNLMWGTGISSDFKKSSRRYGPKILTVEGKIVKKQKEGEELSQPLWVAFNSRYFAAAMIPDQSLNTSYRIRKITIPEQAIPVYVENPEDLVELVVNGAKLGPKEIRSDKFRLFIGPKINSILKRVEAPGNPIYKIRLNQLIDFGFFGWLSKIMLSLLLFSHKITHNYGLAIILLTILIKIMLYPLTHKSLKSAREMQKIQPEIAKLKEKYRDDPQRLNKALIRLYKEHGVNPMSGCWPMLLQLPIFWALFNTLREAIELRGAHFVLWIKDLSEPDTIGVIPGLGFPIRVLPILMGISMFYQQRISTTMSDPQQAKFMKYMPLIFTFFFFGFPSGLVLYWLSNNLLTIIQQYIMNRWMFGKTEEEVS